MTDDAELDTPMPRLKVTCTSVDCEKNLHCFLKKRGMPEELHGTCRACNADLINWERVHRRDATDQKFVFAALKNEMIRHYMWHIDLDSDALRKAQAKGKEKLYNSVSTRLRSSIGKAQGAFDGRQTPMQGNAIYYAQHATATCCRKCLNYWHDIPTDRALTLAELAYCEQLVIGYLEDRLPDLDPQPRAQQPNKKRSSRRR